MCTNYQPPEADLFEAFTDFPAPSFDYPRETYKDYVAPILRFNDGEHSTDPATFGLVPYSHIPSHIKKFDTMNARAETIGEKRSFSGAWKKLQLCLIPCSAFYEPNYETGKAVRRSIGVATGQPFAIAGLWRQWRGPEGTALSFTMLTVNADEHPLMKRFHKPGAEKRSVVLLRPEEYGDWLGSSSTDEARSFLNLFPADEMLAEGAPKPPRRPMTETHDGLFDQAGLD
ncbi:Putative SOS response-associated peptidase YedK [Burkholderia sp. GAS332]|nr:Putative SOS response-associated peptidase YedK [Burkholderia sp. GAS332]